MSDNSADRFIDDLIGLNDEEKKLMDRIEHMSAEEEKVDDINDEDMNYDREDDDL